MDRYGILAPMKWWMVVVALVGITGSLLAQSVVMYNTLDGDTTSITLRGTQPQQYMAEYLVDLQSRGYTSSSIDSTVLGADTSYYQLHYGARYQPIDVTVDSSVAAMLLLAGLSPAAYDQIRLDRGAIRPILRKAGTYLSSHGYPFYQVGLEDLTWKDDVESISPMARLTIDRGQRITFDSLRIEGDYGIVSNNYYQQYLGIRRGDLYDHRLVEALDRKLRNLPFLQLDRSSEVNFVNGIAEVILPVKERKASRFDFIVGLVPADQSGGQQQYTITGDFLAEMVNKLGRGERLYAQLRRLRPEVQEVDLQVDYPYLLNLPLGVDFDFRIFRNSDSFIEVITKAGLQFILSGNDRVGVRLSNTTNRILEVDTASILQAGRLPDQLDVTLTSGGLTLDMQHTDYRINPSRGWQVQASGDFGIRNVIRNNTIGNLSTNDLDFEQAYDTLQTMSFQTDLQLTAAAYLPPNSWSTIRLAVDLAYKYSAEPLYNNELYRIGGNRRLRGFEEQSVLTDVFVIPSLEYRLLLDRNSYLSLPIIEAGLFRTGDLESKIWEQSLAVGMGLSFSTSAGIFNVSFVAGQRRDIPLNIQTAKIHFGYLSLF